MANPSQKHSFMPEVGAAMDFYERVKDSYPTAKQIQELFAVMGTHVPLEQIEADRALLLVLQQTGQQLPYDGKATHD